MSEIGYKTLQTIEKKVFGQDKPGLPLSVQGQVDELISLATNIDNLCEMYIGWGAYM
jgi:serine/threonine-protein kinase ATR